MSPRRSRAPLPPGFAIIWVSVAVDLVGFGIVLPILPIYAKRFHASSLEATLLVAAFSAGSFVASPLWGRLSDRVGRKPVLLVSLAGTAVGSLLTGVAGGLVLLFVGRVVDGISGASVSVAQASVSDLAPPSERPRLFGLLGAAFGLGFVAGPAIGALAALGGPRVPFLLAAAISGVNAVVAIRRLPETSSPGDRVRRRGVNPLGGLVGAGSVGARAVAPLIGVAFCALVAFSAFEATFALFGRRHLGFGIGSSAAVFAAVGVVIVVVEGGLVRVAVDRLGELGTLRSGLALNAAGLGLLASARSWLLAAPALVLLAAGQGLVQPTMSSALAGRADPGRRGQVLGAQQSAGGLARVVGPALGGALLGGAASGVPYVAGAGLTVAALATAFSFGSRPKGWTATGGQATPDVTVK
ncbi:MAG TPA: MFS transporter [Acidimicrobiales bacterium]|jgi:multidrug resistance protein|nr:MFS transporter [Acidimicrobiales bacterium]